MDMENLEKAVVGLMQRLNKTLATAESCTGGLLAKRLTDIPGASAVFPGGVVAYSNPAKIKLLGLDPALIAEKGAVSHEVALAMADGARDRFGADIGIGITGIAGPDSDGSGIEPGTVHIALATHGKSECRSFKLSADRDGVRFLAASNALDMVHKYLAELLV